jgi:hypothetical protein
LFATIPRDDFPPRDPDRQVNRRRERAPGDHPQDVNKSRFKFKDLWMEVLAAGEGVEIAAVGGMIEQPSPPIIPQPPNPIDEPPPDIRPVPPPDIPVPEGPPDVPPPKPLPLPGMPRS